MSAPKFSRDDVEAIAEETRKARQKETAGERENEAGERVKDISFGKAGDMDAFYARSERGNYLSSIGPEDDADEEDQLSAKLLQRSSAKAYAAPQRFLEEAAKQGEDIDPFEETRTKTIAEREDDYHARRRKLQISPERRDPFLEGIPFCLRTCRPNLSKRVSLNLSKVRPELTAVTLRGGGVEPGTAIRPVSVCSLPILPSS